MAPSWMAGDFPRLIAAIWDLCHKESAEKIVFVLRAPFERLMSTVLPVIHDCPKVDRALSRREHESNSWI